MTGRRYIPWLAVAGLLSALPASEAKAQRPVQLSDPFHWNESARRTFFDRYAFTGEVSSRSSGAPSRDGLPTGSGIDYRVRFDSELTRWLDLSAIVDAVGGSGTRSVSLTWLVLKYYRYIEETHSDYAVRLAVDPSSDGRAGFPQVDLAFLYTEPLSSVLMSVFAVGLRRVNVGSLQWTADAQKAYRVDFAAGDRPRLSGTRAIGTEIHGMMKYNLLLDPAGSNLFVNFLVEAGSYDIVETVIAAGRSGDPGDFVEVGTAGEGRVSYRGGAFWTRFGVEFSRPRYLVLPYVAIPITQWTPDRASDTWHRAQFHVGLQLTIR